MAKFWKVGRSRPGYILIAIAVLSVGFLAAGGEFGSKPGSAAPGRELPCGNGLLEGVETCEPPGSRVEPFGNICRLDCTFCGDGFTNVDVEQCEPHHTDCLDNCRYPARFQLIGASIEVVHNWSPVGLKWAVEDPVIIAGPPTVNDPDPGVVRIRNVSSRSFEARFQEWDYLDGIHARERLGYLALPSGTHRLDDGSFWEAGTFELPSTATFQRVHFSTRLPDAPRVFLTVQTDRGGRALIARLKDVDNTGFDAGLFFEEDQPGPGPGETVGYLAISGSSGSGAIRRSRVKVLYRLERFDLDHRWAPFGTSQLRFEEERSRDDEVEHALETVDTLGVGNLTIAQSSEFRDPDTAAIRRDDHGFDTHLVWGMARGVAHDTSYLPLADLSALGDALVLKPYSSDDPDPAAVMSVGGIYFEGDGARLRARKWPYLADESAVGDTFFLYGSIRGHYNFGDVDMEADYEWIHNGAFQQIPFRQPFDVPPAVFTSCYSFDTITPRVRNVTTDGFEAKLTLEESDSTPEVCFLQWIAIEPGHGETPRGRQFDVFRAQAGSDPVRVFFPNEVSRRFATVVVDANTYNGSNPIFPRLLDYDAQSALVFLQEEQSLDLETHHLIEDIVVFVGD